MPNYLDNLTGTAVSGQTNLAQPTVNADDGSWGTSLNNNWKLVDQVFKDDGTGDGVGLKIGSSQTLDATSGTTKVATPSGTTDATTKAYVDAKVPLLVAANLTQVGPAAGVNAAPTFRALVEADIPGLSGAKITSGTVAAAQVATLNQSTTGTAAGLSTGGETCTFSTDKFVFSVKAEAPDFCATSDRNLKQNLKPVKDALGIIRQVKVHRFEWRDSGSPGIGVMAQELQKILPDAVEDGDPMSVHYNYLFSVLVQAVQELDQKVSG